MLKFFKNNKNVGTVGCRLHYKDNTLQHDGIDVILNERKKIIESKHIKSRSYYNFNIHEKEVIGNTAGFLMVNKSVFVKNGGFDERFKHCFEDLFLNLVLKINGYNNFNLGQCVCYHFESLTRNIDDSMSELMDDYNEIIVPYIKENFDKLKKHILISNE
jgi:GT2 family glycosyltransferase